jgi:hypothetical protein
VAEQELDLLQFAAGEMTETGARASQVVGRQLVDAGASRSGAHDIPEHLRRHAVAPDSASLVDRAEHWAVRDGRRGDPRVDMVLHPRGDGHRSHVSAFADEIRNHPVLLALLN